MINYILNILNRNIFKDLSLFDIPEAPEERRLVKSEAPANDLPDNVVPAAGLLWVDNSQETEYVIDLDRLRTNTQMEENRELILTGWDITFLKFNFEKEGGNYNHSLATLLKREWATPQPDGSLTSTKDLVDAHTVEGVTAKNFSQRNIAKYVKAFNDALKQTELDKKAEAEKNNKNTSPTDLKTQNQ